MCTVQLLKTIKRLQSKSKNKIQCHKISMLLNVQFIYSSVYTLFRSHQLKYKKKTWLQRMTDAKETTTTTATTAYFFCRFCGTLIYKFCCQAKSIVKNKAHKKLATLTKYRIRHAFYLLFMFAKVNANCKSQAGQQSRMHCILLKI